VPKTGTRTAWNCIFDTENEENNTSFTLVRLGLIIGVHGHQPQLRGIVVTNPYWQKKNAKKRLFRNAYLLAIVPVFGALAPSSY
jgi:Na+-transporting NADH:ubiquinone oxidoreductase subunit NqrC